MDFSGGEERTGGKVLILLQKDFWRWWDSLAPRKRFVPFVLSSSFGDNNKTPDNPRLGGYVMRCNLTPRRSVIGLMDERFGHSLERKVLMAMLVNGKRAAQFEVYSLRVALLFIAIICFSLWGLIVLAVRRLFL